jgi:hypothetical protein
MFSSHCDSIFCYDGKLVVSVALKIGCLHQRTSAYFNFADHMQGGKESDDMPSYSIILFICVSASCSFDGSSAQ